MELFLSTKVLKITCEYVQIAFYVHYKEVRGSVLSLAPVLWEKCMLESDQHTLCCVTGSWAARSSQLAVMLWTSLKHIICLSLQRGQGANSHKRHTKKKNGQNVLRKAQVILTFSTCYGSSTRDICYYNWVKSIRTVKHSAFDFNRKQHPFIIWGWFIISLHNNPYQCHINTNILSYNTNLTLLVKNAGNALLYRIIILQKQFIYEIVATNSSQLSLNGIINYKSVLMTLSLTRKSSKQSQINFSFPFPVSHTMSYQGESVIALRILVPQLSSQLPLNLRQLRDSYRLLTSNYTLFDMSKMTESCSVCIFTPTTKMSPVRLNLMQSGFRVLWRVYCFEMYQVMSGADWTFMYTLETSLQKLIIYQPPRLKIPHLFKCSCVGIHVSLFCEVKIILFFQMCW